MGLYVDVARFQATNVLPFGTSVGDQDALFWGARDIVETSLAELRAMKGGTAS